MRVHLLNARELWQNNALALQLIFNWYSIDIFFCVWFFFFFFFFFFLKLKIGTASAVVVPITHQIIMHYSPANCCTDVTTIRSTRAHFSALNHCRTDHKSKADGKLVHEEKKKTLCSFEPLSNWSQAKCLWETCAWKKSSMTLLLRAVRFDLGRCGS